MNKVNGRLGMICRSLEHLDGDMLIELDKSIVRANLEYCTVSVWSLPSTKEVSTIVTVSSGESNKVIARHKRHGICR